ncbi:hypothetical protein KUM42_10310 [Modestobacter sp. L9-4]|uniref:hypothetical protein n=1 Tax=Modestobacter sp. L9-4 TaxID=2851567 RepID=UPI001C75FD7F|nr:hypothetical protein [Modestobacter sp. L9-4]QXG74313.1 hypothetical protein KUM42_10310 [Modestobacter sp. L9-4]
MRTHARARRRLVGAAVLGWLTVAAVLAPAAGAAAAVTVPIRDLSTPVATVDAGGSVTFVNQVPGTTVQVGDGGLLPSLVEVTAQTVLTLQLPSGTVSLGPGEGVTEQFTADCGVCTITYAYRLDTVGPAALDAGLPALPVRAPLVVRTTTPPLPAAPPPAQPAPVPPAPAPSVAAPPVTLPTAAPADTAPPADVRVPVGDPSPVQADGPVPAPTGPAAPAPAVADPGAPAPEEGPTPVTGASPAATPSAVRPVLPPAVLDPASDDLAGSSGQHAGGPPVGPGETTADDATPPGAVDAATVPPPELSLPAVLALVALTTVGWALVRTLRGRWADR